MIIIILEDQYTEKISNEILERNSNFKIPIKWNIKNPSDYMNIIESIVGEYIILLDNYFPGTGYEDPLGNDFLSLLLKTGKDYKIVCISDRGKRLLDEYDNWKFANNKGWILGWCPNKDGNEVYDLINGL